MYDLMLEAVLKSSWLGKTKFKLNHLISNDSGKKETKIVFKPFKSFFTSSTTVWNSLENSLRNREDMNPVQKVQY